MTNKEIAKEFQYLGDIMELHGENPYKVKSYQNAYLGLRKLPGPISEMTAEQIESIKGVGKAIGGKIRELLETGQMAAIKNYEEITPEGVRDMLKVRGFGPKKARAIWKELGVETIGELLYACNENRLIELNGFGAKTQEDLKQKLEYFLKSKGRFLYADLERKGQNLLSKLEALLPEAKISFVGEMRRCCNIIESIKILIGYNGSIDKIFETGLITKKSNQQDSTFGSLEDEVPIEFIQCRVEEFGSKLFMHTAGEEFLKAFLAQTSGLDFRGIGEEPQVFEKAKMAFIVPEMREEAWAVELAIKPSQKLGLIEGKDIKGVVHVHTTYSDGVQTLREMAEAAQVSGYQYIGITDHSKSAFYANGLKVERLYGQWAEIDQLNSELAPFQIFKGIESDILADGPLDYEEDILRQFDFIIASVHSNLRMDEKKATDRIIKAVENPFTNILGHPTGRLLLSRQGYPLDMKKVIDACAANKVAVELNANPYRLDLDWGWIQYALEKGVLISIDPDAHSAAGIKDIHFGVLSARKGGLTPVGCLTAFDAGAFKSFIRK